MNKLVLIFTFVVALSANGTTHAAEESPREIAGATTIDSATAKRLFDKGIPFVDVRTDSDWDAGRVPGAVHLELKNVFAEGELLRVVEKDQEVVFYCNGPKCLRSSKACTKAVDWGFTKVYYFRDGFPAWDGAGFPIE